MKPRKKPIHPYLKKVGANIKYLRNQKKISLEDVGAAIGIDGSNMQKIEKGANITLSSLMKIFIVLETSPMQFFSSLKWDLSTDDIDSLTIPRLPKKKAAVSKPLN
jgi:transcriptional regulator with XRE-family HTH domain